MSVTRAANDANGDLGSASAIVRVIAAAGSSTRTEIAEATGLSRTTVAKRIELLIEAGLVTEREDRRATGGRPAQMLRLNAERGVIAGVDVGEDHVRVALTDFNVRLIHQVVDEVELDHGPERVIARLNDSIARLLTECNRHHRELRAICVGLPAPVDWQHGRVVGPSVMRGWDGYDVKAALQQTHDVLVVVDNDVNLLGLAESRVVLPTSRYMLYVKAGTGIGSAILQHGKLYRGAQGAAGDIGHIRLEGRGEHLCRCGNTGCVEAVAAGWALARDLQHRGLNIPDALTVIELVQSGNPEAIQALREAGRALGEAIASAVSLLNPDVLVLGGTLAQAGDYLLLGVREIVYQRSLPLAIANLQVRRTRLDKHAGVLGAAHLALDELMLPDAIHHMIPAQ